MKDDQLFPSDVASLAVAAPGLPPPTHGWHRESAFRALDALGGSKVAVIEMEVYDRVLWGYASAQESWQCDPTPNELASEFALRSRTEARLWIEAFPREEVLFVIEFSTQDIAAEAYGVQFHPIDDAG